ncbi:acyl-CoA desaturase [Gilvimarinus sp. SDUM040013]|uniref:Acyl-CoA desaturase n=1 Tax=Gilvimarinus gilvus TaxID=3058038 RepID=A0ABU4S1D2_9GAMM|nr:acyl-CoA desaturase [Gilvimarinus sp. SDUM040013]MDO3386372.1 acyl-CoA desaturase [Gilvimarinus sp. SDUM040013]MDX6849638.1 acyl-CoA desaturase [Gilvimarinus sp. SDUM040013]
MKDTGRVSSCRAESAFEGTVVWSPLKSVWFLANLAATLLIAPLVFSLLGFLIFLLLTAVTLCFGHSLGMHRLLIHRSYECPIWMEYIFVYLGVLVGMAGPIGMMKQHDLRDWAQRQTKCHDFLLHGSNIIKDGWWQLNCDLELADPPEFTVEAEVLNNRFYLFLEKYWLMQQLTVALPLYVFGGLSWLVWGVCVRVVVSVGGHWLVGYFAHNHGQRTWRVEGAAVQGHNIRIVGLLSMGEAWHNNHHAYPGSAMLGLYKDEPDPGWWVLNALLNLGLVNNIKLPKDLPSRGELVAEDKNLHGRVERVPEKCDIATFIRGG